MKIFTQEEIRQFVQINREAISIVENGFTSLAEGKAAMPPIMRVDIPENNGEVDVKTAYIKGEELGEITSGQTAGRENDEQITVCDLTGTGVQDTAIALYAFQAMTSKK